MKLLTVLLTVHFIHQILTVYQDIAILPTESLDSTLDRIVANYSIRNRIKIPHNFLPYYQLYCHNCKACLLYFAVDYLNSTQMTLRHLFLSWSIFDSISDSTAECTTDCTTNHTTDRISSSKYWQCIKHCNAKREGDSLMLHSTV